VYGSSELVRGTKRASLATRGVAVLLTTTASSADNGRAEVLMFIVLLASDCFTPPRRTDRQTGGRTDGRTDGGARNGGTEGVETDYSQRGSVDGLPRPTLARHWRTLAGQPGRSADVAHDDDDDASTHGKGQEGALAPSRPGG